METEQAEPKAHVVARIGESPWSMLVPVLLVLVALVSIVLLGVLGDGLWEGEAHAGASEPAPEEPALPSAGGGPAYAD